MKTLATLIVALAMVSSAQGAVIGKEIDYTAGDQTMKGYIAYDDSLTEKRPGVLVVHEWWGHNEYARMRARQLAQLGYTALALDMYGNGKTVDHPKKAASMTKAVWANLPVATQRFRAAYDLLQQQDTVNGRIAAIGYCFGGSIVLEMARQGMDLQGVASFHGSLSTPTTASRDTLKAKILVANGADDPFTRPAQIKAFKAEMAAAHADMEFINYKGAKHAFTNPDATALGQKFELPLAYNAEADAKSWDKLRDFLSRVLQ